jgi:hypothetical protein
MDVSEYLTEKELKEILLSLYEKGMSEVDLGLKDFVNEIKQHIILKRGISDLNHKGARTEHL